MFYSDRFDGSISWSVSTPIGAPPQPPLTLNVLLEHLLFL